MQEEDHSFDDGDAFSDDLNDADNKQNGSDEEAELGGQIQKTADEIRLEMAKKMIAEAKMLRKRKAAEKYSDDENESAEEVTNILQSNLMKKRKLAFNPICQEITASYNKNEQSLPNTILKGHKKPITCCRIIPLAKKLISGGKDGALLVWDLSSFSVPKKVVLSYGQPKDPNGHHDEILTMDVSFDGKYLISAGKDRMIIIWNLIDMNFKDALRGHRDTINSLKFKVNSYEFCSVSADRSFKVWDAAQGGFMENFFGHSSEVIAVDALGKERMVSTGFDKKPIIWKLETESQLIFKTRNYSLDAVFAFDDYHFVTSAQNGEIALWNTNKMKPLVSFMSNHKNGWVGALGGMYQSDLLISGGIDGKINIYKVGLNEKKMELQFSLQVGGIINWIDFDPNEGIIAVVSSGENRLGRWITTKDRSKITLFKFKK